jgi:hypothetical protein
MTVEPGRSVDKGKGKRKAFVPRYVLPGRARSTEIDGDSRT